MPPDSGVGYSNAPRIDFSGLKVGSAKTALGVLLKTSSEYGDMRAWCSGTLVAPQYFLTAAHCVYSNTTKSSKPDTPDNLVVFFPLSGAHQVSEVIVRSTYKTDSSGYPLMGDIALLRLDSSVDGITPVALEPAPIGVGMRAKIGGFGSMGTVSTPDVPINLLRIGIQRYDDGVTISRCPTIKTSGEEEFICVGSNFEGDIGLFGGTVLCKGDSGSGIFREFKNGNDVLIGVLSTIISPNHVACRKPVLNHYTNISGHLEWISLITGKSEFGILDTVPCGKFECISNESILLQDREYIFSPNDTNNTGAVRNFSFNIKEGYQRILITLNAPQIDDETFVGDVELEIKPDRECDTTGREIIAEQLQASKSFAQCILKDKSEGKVNVQVMSKTGNGLFQITAVGFKAGSQ